MKTAILMTPAYTVLAITTVVVIPFVCLLNWLDDDHVG